MSAASSSEPFGYDLLNDECMRNYPRLQKVKDSQRLIDVVFVRNLSLHAATGRNYLYSKRFGVLLLTISGTQELVKFKDSAIPNIEDIVDDVLFDLVLGAPSNLPSGNFEYVAMSKFSESSVLKTLGYSHIQQNLMEHYRAEENGSYAGAVARSYSSTLANLITQEQHPSQSSIVWDIVAYNLCYWALSEHLNIMEAGSMTIGAYPAPFAHKAEVSRSMNIMIENFNRCSESQTVVLEFSQGDEDLVFWVLFLLNTNADMWNVDIRNVAGNEIHLLSSRFPPKPLAICAYVVKTTDTNWMAKYGTADGNDAAGNPVAGAVGFWRPELTAAAPAGTPLNPWPAGVTIPVPEYDDAIVERAVTFLAKAFPSKESMMSAFEIRTLVMCSLPTDQRGDADLEARRHHINAYALEGPMQRPTGSLVSGMAMHIRGNTLTDEISATIPRISRYFRDPHLRAVYANLAASRAFVTARQAMALTPEILFPCNDDMSSNGSPVSTGIRQRMYEIAVAPDRIAGTPSQLLELTSDAALLLFNARMSPSIAYLTPGSLVDIACDRMDIEKVALGRIPNVSLYYQPPCMLGSDVVGLAGTNYGLGKMMMEMFDRHMLIQVGEPSIFRTAGISNSVASTHESPYPEPLGGRYMLGHGMGILSGYEGAGGDAFVRSMHIDSGANVQTVPGLVQDTYSFRTNRNSRVALVSARLRHYLQEGALYANFDLLRLTDLQMEVTGNTASQMLQSIQSQLERVPLRYIKCNRALLGSVVLPSTTRLAKRPRLNRTAIND